MFYATRITKDAGIKEQQVLKFYDKADRAAYLAKDITAAAIVAKDAAKLKPAAPGWTVADKSIGITFFAQIVV